MSMKIFNVPQSLICRNGENVNSKSFSLKEEYKSQPYRTDFMRDRDRILYSTAFRRLAGKTQIYTVGIDDHKRNRLTHTLEVAQISRTIAKALDLDQDLAEAIALAHDFGHTPFGHAGERMLHEIMMPNSAFVKKSPFRNKSEECIKERFGRENSEKANYVNEAFGFKHNIQSVRVNVSLEDSYRDASNNNIGLNLTNFTLYGTMIHSRLNYKGSSSKYPNYQNAFEKSLLIDVGNGKKEFAWSFEAYIVALADEIAQWHHDLEDALRGGALPINDICDAINKALGNKLDKKDKENIKIIAQNPTPNRKCIVKLSHIVINTLIGDVVDTSKHNFKTLEKKLNKKNIHTSEELFKKAKSEGLKKDIEKVISLSEKIDKKVIEKAISGSVHHSRNVERMNEKGRYVIRKLFEAYYAHPQQLPDGCILHIMIDTNYYNGKEGCRTVDDLLKKGIGPVRVDFDDLMKNPTIFIQCVLMRRICDHIACMTDHYAIEEYNNLYG